jgi:hypothetical protein
VESSTSTARSDSAAKIIQIESGGDDVFSTLEDIVEHPAKKWTPKAVPKGEDPDEWIVSDRVSGVVEYLEERTGDFGSYLMAELRQKSGERISVAGFGTVLDGWFRILRVSDGLAIMYHGTKPSSKPGNQDYDDFEVIVVRNGRRVSQSYVLGKTDEPMTGDEDTGEVGGALPEPGDA